MVTTTTSVRVPFSDKLMTRLRAPSPKKLCVKTISGKTMSIHVVDMALVQEIKEMAAREGGVAEEGQSPLWQSTVLADTASLRKVGLASGTTLCAGGRLLGGSGRLRNVHIPGDWQCTVCSFTNGPSRKFRCYRSTEPRRQCACHFNPGPAPGGPQFSRSPHVQGTVATLAKSGLVLCSCSLGCCEGSSCRWWCGACPAFGFL